MKVYVVRTPMKVLGVFDNPEDADRCAYTRARFIQEFEVETEEDRLAVERERVRKQYHEALKSHKWEGRDDDYGSYDGTFCSKCDVEKPSVVDFGQQFKMGRRDFSAFFCPSKERG